MPEPTIFVQIASYRDPDCRNTVASLFKQATQPHRIKVGIVWQASADDNFGPIHEDEPYRDNVVVQQVEHTRSKGVCWARSCCQQLHDGEDYALQIDSHLRFSKNWDSELLESYQLLKNSGIRKPVISHYPPEFTLDGKYSQTQGKMAPHFRDDGLPIYKLSGYRIDQSATLPAPSASIGAGFLFAHSSYMTEVPYDPYIYFQGEEITLSARLWTNGWDIFNPRKIVAHHLYKSQRSPETGEKISNRTITTHGMDHVNHRTLERRSTLRVLHLLGIRRTDNTSALENLEQYGLGTERSLSQFENYSGINLQTSTRNHFSRVGFYFLDGSAQDNDKNAGLRAYFRTAKDLEALARYIDSLGVKSVLELGLHAARSLPEFLDVSVSCLGIDNDASTTVELRALNGRRNNTLYTAQDYLSEWLYDAELVCINLELKAMTRSQCWQLMKNVANQRSRFIAIISETSERCPLHDSPFFFPPAICCINGDRHTYHVWQTRELIHYLHPMDAKNSELRSLLIPVLEGYVATLRAAFDTDIASCQRLFTLIHTQLNSTMATDYLDTWAAANTHHPRMRTAYADLIRVRFWSNENRLLTDLPFLKAADKDLAIAIASEYISLCAST